MMIIIKCCKRTFDDFIIKKHDLYHKKYLKFYKSRLSSLFPPIFIMALDFECRNIDYNPDDIDLTTIKPPRSTKYRQIPMAYSCILSSPYKKWQAELPTHLKKAECKILNESIDSLENFYLYFLKSLRSKLFHINEFI